MSRLSNLLPLIILFIVLGGAAYVGYQIYLWSTQLSDQGKKHMEKKNMSFTKEGGLKVGVKELRGEAYEDKTQHALVNMWTTSSEARKAGTGASPRPGNSRAASSASGRPGNSRTPSAQPATASPAPPTQRTESSKSNSSVPGGW